MSAGAPPVPQGVRPDTPLRVAAQEPVLSNSKFWRLFRLVSPCLTACLIPTAYVLLPMYSGCGPVADWTSADARANYWVFATATGIWNTASQAEWLGLCFGLSPGCSRRTQALSVVLGTLKHVPVFVLLKYLGHELIAYRLGTGWFGYYSCHTLCLVYSVGAWRNRSRIRVVTSSGVGKANAVRLYREAASRPEDEEWFARDHASTGIRQGLSMEHSESSLQNPDPSTTLGTSRDDVCPSNLNGPVDDEVILFRSVTRQLLANGLFCATSSGVYALMQFMLGLAVGTGKQEFNYSIYVMYLVVNVVTKGLLKAVGFLVDSGKQGTGMFGYYIAEFVAAFYYYSFYRAMFDKVSSWGLFCALQALHLFFEWVHCPLRATDWYFYGVRRLVNRAPPRMRKFLLRGLLTAQSQLTAHEWRCFIGLDTVVRIYALADVLFSYTPTMCWLHAGYSGYSYHVFKAMTPEHMRVQLEQFVVMFVTEVINVILMDMWFKRRLGPVGCVGRFGGLLKSDLFYIFLTSCCGTVGTEIYAGLVSDKFCSTLDPWEVRSLDQLDAGHICFISFTAAVLLGSGVILCIVR